MWHLYLTTALVSLATVLLAQQPDASIVVDNINPTILYSPRTPGTYGPCLVEFDGVNRGTVSGYATAYGPPRMLWKQETMVHRASDNSSYYCSLDYFVYVAVTATSSSHSGDVSPTAAAPYLSSSALGFGLG
ncbi:hypothetical protein BKA62DRAFT_735209, partial [Auriculariales sp. MPI-PUGE-AT-0066]